MKTLVALEPGLSVHHYWCLVVVAPGCLKGGDTFFTGKERWYPGWHPSAHNVVVPELKTNLCSFFELLSYLRYFKVFMNIFGGSADLKPITNFTSLQNKSMLLLVMTYIKWYLVLQFFLCSSCLCSWLLQDVSCPTCRRTLSADIGLNHHAHNHGNNDNMENSEEVPNENPVNENENRGGYRNYFFYLDGQQIANWFPSFSIEVFHGRGEDREREVNDMVCHCSCSGASQPAITCSKLTIEIPERCQWHLSGIYIVNFEHISYLILVFLLLTLGILLSGKNFEKNFRILVKKYIIWIFYTFYGHRHMKIKKPCVHFIIRKIFLI